MLILQLTKKIHVFVNSYEMRYSLIFEKYNVSRMIISIHEVINTQETYDYKFIKKVGVLKGTNNKFHLNEHVAISLIKSGEYNITVGFEAPFDISILRSDAIRRK